MLRKLRLLPPFLLILLFVFYIANLIVWQSQNSTYFNYDSLRHFLKSLYIFEELRSPGADLFSRLRLHLDSDIHSPLVYFISSIFYFFITPTQNNATLINTCVFLIILLVSLYKLGKFIKDEYLGILACAIILFYPVVFTQTRIYMLDFPLLSIISLNIYFILRSENFKNKKYTFLFWFSAVICIFVRINYLIFITPPFIYCLFNAIKKKNISTKGILVILIILAVSGFIYYMALLPHVLKPLASLLRLKSSIVSITWSPPYLQTIPFFLHKIRSMLWYGWGFINWQAGFFYFVFLLWGLFKLLKSENIHKGFILTWLGGAYFILCWFVYGIDKDMEVSAIRYSMPLLVPISLITAYGVVKIKRKRVRRLLVSIVLIYAVANSLFLSYPIFKEPIIIRLNINQDKYHLLPSYINFFSTEPLIISGSNWLSIPNDKKLLYKKIEEIFFIIEGFYKGRKITTIVLSDDPHFWHLKYLSFKHNKDMHFICNYSRIWDDLKDFRGLRDKMQKMDFVIKVKGGFEGERYLLGMIRKFVRKFDRRKENFKLLHKIDIEEYTIYLYKNKLHPKL